MTFSGAIKVLIPLLAGVYLGFYGFALVMSVFGPGEIIWFTIVAIVCVLVWARIGSRGAAASSRSIPPVRLRGLRGPVARSAVGDDPKLARTVARATSPDA